MWQVQSLPSAGYSAADLFTCRLILIFGDRHILISSLTRC